MKTIIAALLTSVVFASFTEVRYDLIGQQQKQISKTNKQKVLIFLSPTCPCSQKQFDYINMLSKKFTQLEFIGFSSNKFLKEKESQEYFKTYKIDFPIFNDQDLKYANLFNALKTPHIFVLDKENKVIYQGAVTNKRDPKLSTKFYLNDILTAIKNKEELPYTTSKALGCYIAR